MKNFNHTKNWSCLYGNGMRSSLKRCVVAKQGVETLSTPALTEQVCRDWVVRDWGTVWSRPTWRPQIKTATFYHQTGNESWALWRPGIMSTDVTYSVTPSSPRFAHFFYGDRTSDMQQSVTQQVGNIFESSLFLCLCFICVVLFIKVQWSNKTHWWRKDRKKHLACCNQFSQISVCRSICVCLVA